MFQAGFWFLIVLCPQPSLATHGSWAKGWTCLEQVYSSDKFIMMNICFKHNVNKMTSYIVRNFLSSDSICGCRHISALLDNQHLEKDVKDPCEHQKVDSPPHQHLLTGRAKDSAFCDVFYIFKQSLILLSVRFYKLLFTKEKNQDPVSNLPRTQRINATSKIKYMSILFKTYLVSMIKHSLQIQSDERLHTDICILIQNPKLA